jgi:hypothetical protein
MPDHLETLTRINLDDLVNAFGWQNHVLLARFLRSIFFLPAQIFAQQMLDFDTAIGQLGLAEAACKTERLYVRDVRVFGGDRIPTGPCLILSNHPGLTDTLALFAALGRNDLKIIALDRPFLVSLPNVARQLFFVTEQAHERMALVRHVSQHLRAGGAVLTFPAGHTEPDPDIYEGAVKSLDSWIESVRAFLRLAPQTTVVAVCVRGVTWNQIARQPIVRLRRTQDDQQLLASALQLLSSISLRLKPVVVRVQIGIPVHPLERDQTAHHGRSLEPVTVHQAVLADMKALIENAPQGQGRSIFL